MPRKIRPRKREGAAPKIVSRGDIFDCAMDVDAIEIREGGRVDITLPPDVYKRLWVLKELRRFDGSVDNYVAHLISEDYKRRFGRPSSGG